MLQMTFHSTRSSPACGYFNSLNLKYFKFDFRAIFDRLKIKNLFIYLFIYLFNQDKNI
jgi:hypothetical protein